MNFIRRDAWHLESECGKYAVNKVIMGGKPHYSAIRLGVKWSMAGSNFGWDGSVRLMAADNSKDCKAACVADRENP